MSTKDSSQHIDDEGLSLYGENVARLLKVNDKVRGTRIAGKLSTDIKRLGRRRAAMLEEYGGSDKVPPAAEWLMDNYYLVRREGMLAAEDFSHAGTLPATGNSAVLISLCQTLSHSAHGVITRNRCEQFFKGCQLSYVLTRRELDLLVPALKTAVIIDIIDLYLNNTLTDEASFTAKNLFTSLRELSVVDFSDTMESIDQVEQLFMQDPLGLYPLMSDKTKNQYKKRIERIAKQKKVSETSVAERALDSSRSRKDGERHIGFPLFGKPDDGSEGSSLAAAYIILLSVVTVVIAAAIAAATKSIAAFFVLLLPIFELLKIIIDRLLICFVKPAHISRLELSGGIPKEGRTICVISALLTSADKGEKLAGRLEQFRLASRDCGEHLLFGILADLPDADEELTSGDEEKINSAKLAVDALNKKYGGGFFFFVRSREYNSVERRYTAYERKRGAIHALCKLIGGCEPCIDVISGTALSLRGVRYILTLDEDTRLLPGAAKQLIGAMLHPLNAPIIDKEKGRVVSGHAVIHPRISTELCCVNLSGFTQIFAGQGGVDPYGSDVSEIYMDVFESGGFAGKGIIDVSAYLRCLDGSIPEGRVLSHDAIEGAYLRGGYMTDVELTDSFPSDVLSYFQRMHRWVRGDWQNLPWLFRRGKKLALIDRFRLFDSVRRSAMPPVIFLAFMLAFFFPTTGLTVAALVALLCPAAQLLSAFITDLFSREGAKCRLHSYILHGIQSAYFKTLLKIFVLPFEAFICADAALRSLWRMAVSKKRLLEWTPASVSSGGKTVGSYFSAMWFSIFAGVLTAIFAPSVLGKALAIVWAFSPLTAYSLSKPLSCVTAPSSAERDYLLTRSKQIWAFYADFCTAEDHFLPPDNYQERPPVGVAHRTSPTNIGLCLISCLAALDLGVAQEQEAIGIVENILATMRRLPKWNGHLYNWYDTKTLRPLRPVYVSTVDSGNLAVCLVILREGLLERGQTRLAEMCNELIDPMSFAPLYDSDRRLLSIGLDVEKDALSSNCYDLFASEARSASFFAIARGDIPLKHWQTLSRALVQSDGYRGMVSWTGSMFEYLMPRLFFAAPEGSITRESDRFCVGVQKMRTKKLNLPWGISESAYYSLDPALNYKYKAHGCAALALKRGMDEELVISPYSSFLALCCGRKSAIKNLRESEKYGCVGRYGFWEAIDLSPGRSLSGSGEVVRCVMAHHLGMSIVAAANSLCNGIMRKRLMRDPTYAAYESLMEEKVPLCSSVLHRSGLKAKDKPPRAIPLYWEKRGDYVDFSSPSCCLLSNGFYNIMLTDSGAVSANFGGIAIYNSPHSIPDPRHGVEMFLKSGREITPLLPDPSMEEDAECAWQFCFSGAKIDTTRGGIRSQVLYSVSENGSGEKRIISVSPTLPCEENCKLIVMFEPLLAPYQDYVNHPSFCKLGMYARTLGDSLIIRRLPRGEGKEIFLCFASSEQAEFSARRELVPGRGGIINALESSLPSALGWLRDPMICAEMNIRIKTGVDSAVAFVIAVGETELEAYTAAQKILVEGASDDLGFLIDLAVGLKMSDKQLSFAMDMLCAILYPEASVYSKSELWRFGVSGEKPVVYLEITDEERLPEAESYIKTHAFLSTVMHSFDLVFITDEGGDYLRPMNSSLRELIRRFGGECGVFIVDSAEVPDSIRKAGARQRQRGFEDSKIRYDCSLDLYSPVQSFPAFEWNEDMSFSFYVNHSLPPRAWGNMLTNGKFGFFASDCGTGHMWYGNAREYQITPWLCDSLAVKGPESIEVDGKSMFASPDDTDCRVTYGFGYAKWEKTIDGVAYSMCSFVPPDTDARVIIIDGDNDKPLMIKWRADLVLGSVGERFSGVSLEYEDGTFIATRSGSAYPDSPFSVCSSAPCEAYTSNREKWFLGETDNDLRSGACLAACFLAKLPFVLVCGCDDLDKLKSLCEQNAAFDALRHTKLSWNNTVTKVNIKTPMPTLDRLVNGWLPYQAIACRLLGRCSLYQSGGAFGFRDQLQDAVNIILLDSSAARSQIIDCCRMQYPEGDVMHWWHATGRTTAGVRTRCTDDLLWLPWALCEYVEKTGDTTLCRLTTPFIVSEALKNGDRDRYEVAVSSENEATILEHCKLALELVLKRGTGKHSLLKIGNGDWNDGLSAVGKDGMGESVWLSWFFAHTARRFSDLLAALGDEDSRKYAEAASIIGKAANEAWDGEHYLRGYFDDGTPLGSDSQACCKIDSIAQSFAALCPEADRQRVDRALSCAVARLYDCDNSLVKLLDPPFDNSQPFPGYIESYGPGFRENGGQYTHGAVFFIMALLRENRAEEAVALLKAILPDGRDHANYAIEPYVVAADIYANPDCIGQGGWPWYTGSAAWLFRVVTEDLLGIKKVGGSIQLQPHLPSDWGSCSVSIKSDEGGKTREFLITPGNKTTLDPQKGSTAQN